MRTKLIIAIILLCSFLFGANDPKLVGIYVRSMSGDAFPEEDFNFNVYIDGRPGEVLTETSSGCGYKELSSTLGLCYVNLASFDTAWAEDDILMWEAFDDAVSQGTVNQTIESSDGVSQYDTNYWGGAFLPVTLSSFTAVYQGGTPVLQWVTQSEIDNAGWNIFRSNTENMAESMQVNGELITGAGTTTETQSYTFADEVEIEPEHTYYYMLENVDFSGSSEQYGPISIQIPAEEQGGSPEVPIVYGLHNNYPNPFNPDTKICFVPDQVGKVNLYIFNIKGQKIKTIFTGNIAETQIGELQSFIWDGTNDLGKNVSSGIYFYQYESPSNSQTKKMLLVK
ncbi:MAG: T9SS type A sorting domain-containing protein [Candidatus Cloacimonetes bacterium]|nr:T9SS type A sorting domain-containing protein [Candidatus Cloacimonadota bacterium]